MDVTTIRSSSLSRYPDCPRRWAAQTLRKEIEGMGYSLNTPARTIAAPVGTGVHAGAAFLLRAKKEGQEVIKIADAEDQAISALREAVGESDTFHDELTPTMGVAEQQVIRMLAVFALQIVPYVDPLVVEERLEAEAGCGLILSGQGDNLCRSPNGLRDLKTGSRPNVGGHKPQLGSYSMLFRTHGIDVNEASIDFIQRVKLGKPQPPVITTSYDVGSCEVAARRVIDHISRDLALFRDGDPSLHILPGDAWAFSANPSSNLCSGKWCAAFGTAFCKECSSS